MAEKTKQYQRPVNTAGFEDQELRSTMEEYLSSEPKSNRSVWNFTTITGLSMVFVAMSYLSQNILSGTLGITPGPDLSWILQVLPFIGGAILGVVGFGFMSRKKRKSEKFMKKKTREGRSDNMPGTGQGFSKSDTGKDRLDDFLYGAGEKGRDGKVSSYTDSYAFSHKKKLFRSREYKKIAGVCGGLARYFDVNPTMVRLVFVMATLLGYGSFILVYIAMMIVVPKEPIDNFDF